MMVSHIGDETDSYQDLSDLLMNVTGLNRDVIEIIVNYTRPRFGELVGFTIRISGSSESLGEYFEKIYVALSSFIIIPLTPLIREPIINTIMSYISYRLAGSATNHEFYRQTKTPFAYQYEYRIFRNVTYFFDKLESNVIGYVSCREHGPFEFVSDCSLDVHTDLNRGINEPDVVYHHDRTDLIDNIGDNTNALISVYHPTRHSSDSKVVYYDDAFEIGCDDYSNFHLILRQKPIEGSRMQIINRVNGGTRTVSFKENSTFFFKVFEPVENRFIRITADNCTRIITFHEIIFHPENESTSFRELKSPKNVLLDNLCSSWKWYRGMLLGHDEVNKILMVIRVVKDTVSIQKFSIQSRQNDWNVDTSYILCGFWYVEISYFKGQIHLRRFSLDPHVLS